MFPRFHFSLERWKKNKDYGVYVSNMGNIRLIKNKKILEPRVSENGYFFVFTQKGKITVHRLVAYTWLAKERNNENDTIDHIDFNKRNNCVKNLRWLSREENTEYGKYVTQQMQKTDLKSTIIKVPPLTNRFEDFRKSNDYQECGTFILEMLEKNIINLVIDNTMFIKKPETLYSRGILLNIGNIPKKKELYTEIARAIKNHSIYCGRTWKMKDITTGEYYYDL